MAARHCLCGVVIGALEQWCSNRCHDDDESPRTDPQDEDNNF